MSIVNLPRSVEAIQRLTEEIVMLLNSQIPPVGLLDISAAIANVTTIVTAQYARKELEKDNLQPGKGGKSQWQQPKKAAAKSRNQSAKKKVTRK